MSYLNFLHDVGKEKLEMGRGIWEMRNEKLETRNKLWEMRNQEFVSWMWNGIELGPEKWEMGFKWGFSWLKCRPLLTRRCSIVFMFVIASIEQREGGLFQRHCIFFFSCFAVSPLSSHLLVLSVRFHLTDGLLANGRTDKRCHLLSSTVSKWCFHLHVLF